MLSRRFLNLQTRTLNPSLKLAFLTAFSLQASLHILKQPSSHFFGQQVCFGFSLHTKEIDFKKDYYEILEVERGSSLSLIKQSFYRLAKENHPDKAVGNEEKFRLISEAYSVLSNEQKRKIYDTQRGKDSSKAEHNTSSVHQGQRKNDQKGHQEQDQKEEWPHQLKKQAYYHFSQGQWQQYRSGFQYMVGSKQEYQKSIRNTMPLSKLYSDLKAQYEKSRAKDKSFLDDMEVEFKFRAKVQRRRQQNRREYEEKLERMEDQLYNKKIQAFKKTRIGNVISKILRIVNILKNWKKRDNDSQSR